MQFSRGAGVRVNPPEPFDGSRDKAESFMRSCHIYKHLHASQFTDDTRSIAWMLSFFDSGHAASFRADAMAEAEEKDGRFRWSCLYDFQEEFKREF